MKTHLVFGLLTVLLLALMISHDRRKTFSFDVVIAQAEERAAERYRPTPEVDESLRALNYDQYRDIRWNDDHTLWRNQGLPFQTKFFATAHIHSRPVNINQVNPDGAGPVRFRAEAFDLSQAVVTPEQLGRGGFAGFRVHYPLNRPDYLDEVFVFLGASYFRAVAKELVWGLSARGLAIGTGKNEEFPAFTDFWLVEPATGATDFLFYALLDGPSITGAYEFRVFPGVETRMEIRAVLFPRRDIEEAGIAPLTSMYWFGENTSNTFGNFRPEVHDSDGLLFERSNGEWVWRPLAWSQQLQVAVFEDENPRGLGLLQRDRDFSHYQDMEARYHERPSAWVQPHGDWGRGAIRLIQLPTNNEYMDNIVAFWAPEGGLKEGGRYAFSYSLTWFGENGGLPPLARCISTRVDAQDAPYYRMFVLEFAGGELSNLPAGAAVVADATVTHGAIQDVVVQRNDYGGSWRASFVASSDKPNRPVELRCTLRLDGRPLSETWTYTWKN